MLRKTIGIIIFSFCSLLIGAQNIEFERFQGTGYHIPFANYKLGYGDHVNDYDQIALLEWDSIYVTERTTDQPFPDIPKNTGFGIFFKSKATVNVAGCYIFSLNSDDGSLLFIEDSLVLDNGGIIK